VDSSGNVYTTGYFFDTVDFDPGAGTSNLTSVGGTDIFVSKLDTSGNFVWVKQFGGTSNDNAYSIYVDSSGNVYTTGYFNGTVDFDPGAGTSNLTSVGGTDIFVSKLSVPPPDSTAPTVSTLSPADNTTGVSTTANLVITFDEAVDPEAGADNNIVIYKASDDSVIETIDAEDAKVTGGGTTTITIYPDATLDEQTAYYVQVGADAFDDAASNSYAGIADTTSWNFTTGDFTNPTVSTLSPLDNAVDVAIDSNLVLTFDEIVDAETGNIVIKKTSDDSTVETIAVGSTSGTGTITIIINPTANLANSTEYYVTIDATAFDDVNGNSYAGIASTTAWSFTTVAAPAGGSSSGSRARPRTVITPNVVPPTVSNLGLITLKLNSRGEAVKALQKLLNLKLNLNLIADGIFGPKTKAAVIAFQKLNGLVPDGLVGPLTKAKLGQ
jgi:methionine-rich copper-binding protein CopC